MEGVELGDKRSQVGGGGGVRLEVTGGGGGWS